MGTWFVPAQPRTKPGLSPIPPNVPSWCRVSWLLKGLAWRMALSCHSQANHRGRGSDATHKLGSWTCCPQTHRGGGHCRWPVTQAAVGVSPSPPFLDMHCCQRVSWQKCIISSPFHSFLTPHPLILEWRTPCPKKDVLIWKIYISKAPLPEKGT